MMAPDPLAPGQIRLYDHDQPQLVPGEYEIGLTQVLDGIATGPLEAQQRFTVSAPQVALDPTEVAQVYPPDGSSGQYGEALPFALLAEPTLPWERQMGSPGTPWLALLVLGTDELQGASASPSGATTTSVKEFLALEGVLTPRLTLDADVSEEGPCSYVQVSTAVFEAVLPRAEELPYLAHVRQSGASGGGQDLVGVVFANRFPAVGSEGPVKSVVHLVSLEGLEPYLVENPVFTRSGKSDGSKAFESVALLSLASWTFQSLPEPAEGFAGLTIDLLDSEYDPTRKQHEPDRLWLRLPAATTSANDPSAKAAAERLAAGFVPLTYHARTGEETFAWYRGPLAPELPQKLVKEGPFLTADSALAYDPASGTFDASLAAAWQIGRSIALADRAFGRTLLDLRRKLHLLADELYDRLYRDGFVTPNYISELVRGGQLTARLLSVLDADLLAELSDGPGPGPAPAPPPGPPESASADLLDFLAEDEVQAALLELVADELDPVSQWLARLLLLGPVPFPHLVPDARMLPASSPAAGGEEGLVGSIRFFYVDPNWTGALLDGALSIGLESSLQTFFHSITAGLLQEAASEAARQLRSAVSGVAPPPGPQGEDVLCGLLLRSPLVSGWPGLELRPLDANGNELRVLRLDRLAPGVLIAIFDGVPASVSVAEPQVGIRLGLDPQGCLELRQFNPDAEPGKPLDAAPLPVRDPTGAQQLLMRAGGSRVLNIAPSQSSGLISGLVNALFKAGELVEPSNFRSAALATQLISAPQELSFDSAGAP